MSNNNVSAIKSTHNSGPSLEQKNVIEAPINQDVLIVAGAGSGKTYTMTRRVIHLIKSKVPPESILGLTFTNKAAAELLSRVSAEVSASGAKSFLKPEVMTYDAFFQSIVRRYGLLVGFNQNTMPLSDAGAMEIIKSIIGKYLDNPQNNAKNLSKLYNFDTLCADVINLCAEISCSMIGVDSIGETCSSVSQAVQKIREWNNEFAKHLKNVIADRKVESPLASKAPAIPKYKKVKKTAGMSEQDVAKVSAEKFKNACKNYEKYWDDSCLQFCINLYNACLKRDILLDLVLQFDAEKRRVNMAQFSDFTIAAYYLVTHFPSICAQYRNQYSQVLLDEYQDTSTTQAMLINTLFYGGFDAVEGGRTHVMAVGDPFQAIYSFRGASTGAFCKFEQDFNISAQNKYSLTVTRRNSLFILKVANALTEPMRAENGDNSTQNASRRFSSIDDREVQVETLKPKDDAPNGTVGALFMPNQGEEIDAVVRFAKKIVEKYGENPLEPQLAILFRSKAKMPQYAQKLEDAGIRTSIVGYSSIIEKPAVKDVLSLLRVVQDHSDSNSLMRLLATPRFALSTADLSALASIANSANTEYLYNVYASAGLVEDGLPRSQWDCAVRNLRNKANSGEISGQVINIYGGVYLADLIMRDFGDFGVSGASGDSGDSGKSAVAGDYWVSQMREKLSAHAFAAVSRLSKILNKVDRVQRNSLTSVMQSAVEALNVDIDSAVGAALKYKDFSNQTMLNDMHNVLDSLNAIVETYVQEMGEWQDVSLRGLINWIDSAKTLDLQASGTEQNSAQVVLMTVHQSKGLQWPAVAVVGLNEGAFPSNQGDSLKVDDNGQASARIPIEFAASVPSALRVDANILPHFPHTVTRAEAMHPEKAMQDLDSVQKIFDEIKPDRIKALCDFAQAVQEVDSCDSSDSGDCLSEETRRVYNAYKSQQSVDFMPFTQSEERGIQLHMDERHLMYVALTRAKFAALLTGSANSGDSEENGRKRAASVFLKESMEAIKSLNGVIEVKRCEAENSGDSVSGDAGASRDSSNSADSGDSSEDVFGFIAGDLAGELAKEFGKIKVQSDSRAKENVLEWPCALSEDVENALQESAKLVKSEDFNGDFSGDADGNADGKSYLISSQKSLYSRAKAFVQDADLTAQNAGDYSLEDLAKKVEKISNGSRLNVTSLQKISKVAPDTNGANYTNAKTNANANSSSRANDRVYNNLLACIRPIPSVSSMDANLGTKFHAWAQQFVDSAVLSNASECAKWRTIVKNSTLLDEQFIPQDRKDLLYEFNQNRKDSDSQSCALNQWKQRLIESRWAKRVPLAAEMPILMQIDNAEFANRIINGTLDAVFAGGLDASDESKLYTIVDWKTGKRPKTAEDIRLKLEQLDWYRLLLARATNVDLSCIDATLYYVSEARAENREIHALCKTRDEILSEVSF
ncbi:helicase UvrD [Gardnerella vaginalis]|uniref:ATP-dependent DNA helicase n=1 Tax=Gardnerella vaginalis TaxID=2702 RepID=UPI000E2159E1|nr:ATP-dependent DNA helicase [Gardnerella vaginalis]RDW96326.1 helicase UvrD [Gardnerella vaginalis]RDW98542.1 helicase UvrD [Gardnerella vaginalis]